MFSSCVLPFSDCTTSLSYSFPGVCLTAVCFFYSWWKIVMFFFFVLMSVTVNVTANPNLPLIDLLSYISLLPVVPGSPWFHIGWERQTHSFYNTLNKPKLKSNVHIQTNSASHTAQSDQAKQRLCTESSCMCVCVTERVWGMLGIVTQKWSFSVCVCVCEFSRTKYNNGLWLT